MNNEIRELLLELAAFLSLPTQPKSELQRILLRKIGRALRENPKEDR
jgi:hypothetical protein